MNDVANSQSLSFEQKSLVKPLSIGKITLPINVSYAPLAGCSDFPFRMMSSLYQPGLQFCEMVKMDALVRCDPGTFQLLTYSQHMHPIGAQLCGSSPSVAKRAARIIEDLGFDIVDLNCGCPVDKVTKDGGGSGLLKMPHRIGEIVHEMTQAVTIPVCVKIRAGWDEESIVVQEIVRIVESAGAKAITVHGRTRQQGYEGKAQRAWIAMAKEAVCAIPVIGNGDIFSAIDAFSMLEETKCDGVLVARGTMGQPWIVDDIRALSQGKQIQPRSLRERRRHLLQHFDHIVRFKSERKALIDLRRVGCWYFNASTGVKAFREAISHAQSIQDVYTLITSYPFSETESDGHEFSLDTRKTKAVTVSSSCSC